MNTYPDHETVLLTLIRNQSAYGWAKRILSRGGVNLDWESGHYGKMTRLILAISIYAVDQGNQTICINLKELSLLLFINKNVVQYLLGVGSKMRTFSEKNDPLGIWDMKQIDDDSFHLTLNKTFFTQCLEICR